MQESVRGLDADALGARVAALQEANRAELASGDKRKTQVRPSWICSVDAIVCNTCLEEGRTHRQLREPEPALQEANRAELASEDKRKTQISGLPGSAVSMPLSATPAQRRVNYKLWQLRARQGRRRCRRPRAELASGDRRETQVRPLQSSQPCIVCKFCLTGG